MRPALVLTRNSAIAFLSTVTVAPVTSTIRDVPSEVVLNGGRHEVPVRGEPAQCRYRVATEHGQTYGTD
jgi:mRNA interferase MazF